MYAEAARQHSIGRAALFPRLPVSIDFVLAFGCFISMLFILQFGSLGALALIGLGGLYAILRRDVVLEIVWRRAFILIIPALAVMSTLWSVDQAATLRHSLQYLITAGVAILMAGAPRQREIIQGAFFAFGIYATISILFGQSVGMGAAGETAFAGLNGSKNLVADIASTGLLISVGVVLVSGRKGLPFWGPLALIFGGMNAFIVIEARSAGALVAAGVGVMAFCVLSALQAFGVGVRSVLTGLLLVSAITFAAFSRDIAAFAIQFAQDVFDKDPTLTGRTYLWARAFDLIDERPVLGLGFNGFWLQGNPEAEGLWQYAGIVDRGGFNFHNTGVEILVHLGWVGVAVCATVAVICFVGLFYRYVTRPTPEMAVWCSILLYEAIRMPLESLGLLQFHFGTALIFASLGAAIAPARQASASAPPQQVGAAMDVPATRTAGSRPRAGRPVRA